MYKALFAELRGRDINVRMCVFVIMVFQTVPSEIGSRHQSVAPVAAGSQSQPSSSQMPAVSHVMPTPQQLEHHRAKSLEFDRRYNHCRIFRKRVQYSPNSTCCVTSRQAQRVVTWRAVSCVLCRACFNMADDEEAVVLACKTTSCFNSYLLV